MITQAQRKSKEFGNIAIKTGIKVWGGDKVAVEDLFKESILNELSFSSHDKSGGVSGVDNFLKGFKLIAFNFDNEEVFFGAKARAIDIEDGNGEAGVTDSGDERIVSGASNDLDIEDTLNKPIGEDAADIGTCSEAAGVGDGDENTALIGIESGTNDNKPDKDFSEADGGGEDSFSAYGKDSSDSTERDIEYSAKEDLEAKEKKHKRLRAAKGAAQTR